jgi:ABC-type uncharacterized transport system fused permease/ATPase subunit
MALWVGTFLGKDQEQFGKMLIYYLGATITGTPVFVLRNFSRERLALRWRGWMTSYYMDRYFKNRIYYNIQSQSLIDNPDQRIVDDVNNFTNTALEFALALFNAAIDLISFSGILYGIYPPLFVVLIVYSLGGTAISVAFGKVIPMIFCHQLFPCSNFSLFIDCRNRLMTFYISQNVFFYVWHSC